MSSFPSQSIKFKRFWFPEIETYRIKQKITAVAKDRDPYQRSKKTKEIEEQLPLLKQHAQFGSTGTLSFLMAIIFISQAMTQNIFWRTGIVLTIGPVSQAAFSSYASRRVRELQERIWRLHDPISIPHIVDQLPSFWKVSNGKHDEIEAVIQAFQILLADLQTVNLNEHLNDARIGTLVRYCREVLKQPNLTDNEIALVKDLLGRLVDITNPLR